MYCAPSDNEINTCGNGNTESLMFPSLQPIVYALAFFCIRFAEKNGSIMIDCMLLLYCLTQ